MAASTTLTGVQENYGMANDNDLIEMYGVPDTFCEGLARIDHIHRSRPCGTWQSGGCKADPASRSAR
jgi:hypothetical protein